MSGRALTWIGSGLILAAVPVARARVAAPPPVLVESPSRVALVAAGASGRQASGSCPARWQVFARSPATPAFGDVAARSAHDVWAVGETGTGALSRAAVAHWDGHALRISRPFPAGVSLQAVAPVSASDVWVIGSRGPKREQPLTAGWELERPLIAHWDGAAWNVARLPPLRAGARLAEIAAVSRDDVWAVGASGTTTDSTLPLVLHWNGRQWRSVDPRALTPRGAGDTLLPSAFYAIDATAADNVWLVGSTNLNDYHVETFEGLAARWDGRRWRSYDFSSWNNLDAVHVAGQNDVWMVSDADWWSGQALVRWNGHRLGIVRALESETEDLAVLSARDIWLVGETSPNADRTPLVSHWDGRTVRVISDPFQRLRGATLTSISAVSATNIWAAGNHLIARYSC